MKGSYFGSRWRRDRGTFYPRFSKAVAISRPFTPSEGHCTSFPGDFRACAGEGRARSPARGRKPRQNRAGERIKYSREMETSSRSRISFCKMEINFAFGNVPVLPPTLAISPFPFPRSLTTAAKRGLSWTHRGERCN